MRITPTALNNRDKFFSKYALTQRCTVKMVDFGKRERIRLLARHLTNQRNRVQFPLRSFVFFTVPFHPRTTRQTVATVFPPPRITTLQCHELSFNLWSPRQGLLPFSLIFKGRSGRRVAGRPYPFWTMIYLQIFTTSFSRPHDPFSPPFRKVGITHSLVTTFIGKEEDGGGGLWPRNRHGLES